MSNNCKSSRIQNLINIKSVLNSQDISKTGEVTKTTMSLVFVTADKSYRLHLIKLLFYI